MVVCFLISCFQTNPGFDCHLSGIEKQSSSLNNFDPFIGFLSESLLSFIRSQAVVYRPTGCLNMSRILTCSKRNC